jgi:hypothetical protein
MVGGEHKFTLLCERNSPLSAEPAPPEGPVTAVPLPCHTSTTQHLIYTVFPRLRHVQVSTQSLQRRPDRKQRDWLVVGVVLFLPSPEKQTLQTFRFALTTRPHSVLGRRKLPSLSRRPRKQLSRTGSAESCCRARKESGKLVLTPQPYGHGYQESWTSC